MRPTAGQLSHQASLDQTKYDAYEAADIFTHDVYTQLMECAKIHCDIFPDEEFCVCLFIASDPLIHNVRRHKYCAFPYLPKPRPHQSVFLFKRFNQTIQRLWSLPAPKFMAVISEMPYVAKQWKLTKYWCDAFYGPDFFKLIREQHGISMLSEEEQDILNTHGAKVSDPVSNEVKGAITDTFDFSKITVKKVVDENESSLH